jgi:hypothetical protein
MKPGEIEYEMRCLVNGELYVLGLKIPSGTSADDAMEALRRLHRSAVLTMAHPEWTAPSAFKGK